jgi:hypothetical protein
MTQLSTGSVRGGLGQMRFGQRITRLLLIASIVTGWTSNLRPQTPPNIEAAVNPQSQTTGDVLRKIDQLVEQNRQLERQNQELMNVIESLRQSLADNAGETPAVELEQAVLNEKRFTASSSAASGPAETATSAVEAQSPAQEQQRTWGTYTPNFGYKVANTEYGDLNISIYTYARYLNQKGLEPFYTNAFGVTTKLQQRQDFQLQKLQMKFLGWMMDPRFRYFLYAWTSNANQGLGAQVVLAGNLNYRFNDHFTVGAGIYSLPGTRSVEGNFPFWLNVDSRHIADEFFRPSYTSGVKASGTLREGLTYQIMVGNNLSTLGVSAAQLPNNFNTVASALVWMPTTGEFGLGFGDFEWHDKVATRFAAHYTRSDENKQSQPNSEQFENVQLRLSDGSVIFTPNLFGPGITIEDAIYRMNCYDWGVKYHGMALEGEYYLHWLSNFTGTNTTHIPTQFSNGFQIQSSAMVIPKSLQLYSGGSLIIGHYGRPWDYRFGVNYFPYKNRVVRWNSEFLYVYRSPVGYTSVAYPLGGTGPIFSTTLEMAF